MTDRLGAVYRRVRDALRAAGLPSPETDARLLVAEVAAIAPQRLVIEEDRVLCADELERIDTYLKARLARVPVGRIIGHREFWGLEFDLASQTLEPRPDTETLVEAALAFVEESGGCERALRLVDLGTGSGAILVSLLSELPDAWGVATDLQFGALETARRNAARNGVEARARFVCASWMDGLGGEWDLIVSNPPYIPSGVIGELDPEVRAHDPLLALDGGEDGLEPYRRLAVEATEKLKKYNAALLVEIGYDQADDVVAICRAAGFENVGVRQDLAGHDRVVVAWR